MTRKKTTPTRAVARTGAALLVGYASFLDGLKARIRAAQVKAALAVNAELVLLYWHVGRDILARQEQEGWGARVIDRLSTDLHAVFPEMKGFSPRNLKYMRAFAEAWPEPAFVQQVAAQLPWFHNCTLLDRVKGKDVRAWYARQTIEHGWSRSVLLAQIETRLHERAGKALTNFTGTLAPPHSDLAGTKRGSAWSWTAGLFFAGPFATIASTYQGVSRATACLDAAPAALGSMMIVTWDGNDRESIPPDGKAVLQRDRHRRRRS